jgi:hypothetical protein
MIWNKLDRFHNPDDALRVKSEYNYIGHPSELSKVGGVKMVDPWVQSKPCSNITQTAKNTSLTANNNQENTWFRTEETSVIEKGRFNHKTSVKFYEKKGVSRKTDEMLFAEILPGKINLSFV